MTCSRLNVCPKISSHSAGCTIRVKQLGAVVAQLLQFHDRESPHPAQSRRECDCQPRGARTVATARACWRQLTRRAALLLERISRRTRLRAVLGQIRSGVVAEHVLQRRSVPTSATAPSRTAFEFGR